MSQLRSPSTWLNQMGVLHAVFLCLMVVSSLSKATQGSIEEWKSATATYSKDPYASVTTGIRPLSSYCCGGCFELRCVDHILWCLQGSPSVIVTATDFCPPNYGLPSDYGGWCNHPREHFEMSALAFYEIAEKQADMVPVQYRRVNCARNGGLRFTIGGNTYFHQVLITNVGSDGEVIAVKIKGSKTGWLPMARNWGQNWQCNIDLGSQPLSFEVTSSSGRRVVSYNLAPSNWQFGQTFEGKQL